jgi:hypothetical protein
MPQKEIRRKKRHNPKSHQSRNSHQKKNKKEKYLSTKFTKVKYRAVF